MGVDPVTAQIVGSVGSAAVGGLMGGKKQKGSQSTAPTYDPKQKEAMDFFLEEALGKAKKPTFMDRVVESTHPFNKQFDNAQLIKLQSASDNHYKNQLNIPKDDAPTQPPRGGMSQGDSRRLKSLGLMGGQSGVISDAYGGSGWNEPIDNAKYEQFSDSRTARNLPPMPPNEYVAAGQPTMPNDRMMQATLPSLSRPQGLGGMAGGGNPMPTSRFGGPIPAGVETPYDPNNLNIDTVDFSKITEEDKQRFRDLFMNMGTK